MAEFVTISLESNECDICHHDNGEELISYILNDRCLQQQEIWSSKSKTTHDQIRRAHTLCLDRYDHIMKKSFNRFNLLRRSWTGKQREQRRSLTKTDSNSLENLNITRTWTAIKSHSQEELDLRNHSHSAPQTPEQIRRDVHQRSMSEPRVHAKLRNNEASDYNDVKDCLARFSIKELQERIFCYNKKIKDVSTELIGLLQERDHFNQEIEVRRVAIGQLLKLQTGARRSQSVNKKTGLDTPQQNSLLV